MKPLHHSALSTATARTSTAVTVSGAQPCHNQNFSKNENLHTVSPLCRRGSGTLSAPVLFFSSLRAAGRVLKSPLETRIFYHTLDTSSARFPCRAL